MRILLLLLSFGLMADNEIYIDQTGSNVNIDIEQLGSSNLIGGLQATSGSMTAAILNGATWTCLLYTSPSPRDVEESRMPSSA